MTSVLKIRDALGELTLTYEEMCKYHGKDFLGGVALAFKVLELAFNMVLQPGQVPERAKIRLVLGLNPPGILDGFEYLTRAVTQQRIVINKNIEKGVKSNFGHYYFEVHYEDIMISMWLKENLLPEGFTDLAAKCLGGKADEEDMQRWKKHKLELGESIMTSSPSDLFGYSSVTASNYLGFIGNKTSEASKD